MEPSQDPAAAIRFRPSKKRQAYRQRPDDLANPHPPQQQSSQDEQEEEAQSAVTAAMRVRNARRARLRGVGFASDDHDPDHDLRPQTDHDLAAPAKGIPDRFIHQTGLIATLNDKHMNEYIESRLSSARAPGPSQPAPQTDASPEPLAGADPQRSHHHQPTRQGKLFEVEVPADTRRDAQKQKRPASTDPPRPKRGRNRRGSDDMKRDQLVDAFLHENKLDVYDVPVQNSHVDGERDGRSADDRMADEFRRRYMDEVAARRLRRRPPPTKQQKQQRQLQQANVLKGPKLGGSRNVRAAARNILLKEKQEKEREKAGRWP
ncbi:uncharacterized protein MAM_02011 [Metarhizium album ARSEF 1941]|uniref:mRNA splicing factor RNA helicase n=1 Tax=Metarhizium album (strain ARSEF 1941) TaxID=1081103 RepID=A0A0B2X2V6_METAS|nr:uncharacterized protein MAM_02011 [Metarhizium album ARSEF 1941]KHO00088.1 hypothetical protein MAM_02011 [Metarhizium album ARSEF 1941]